MECRTRLRPSLRTLIILVVMGATLEPAVAGHALTSAGGAQLWVARYDGTGHGLDHARAVVVSPDGATVLVTGTSDGATGTEDYVTAAYDAATGTRRWLRRYDGGGGADEAVALAVSPTGSRVFVTGWSAGSNGQTGYATIAYDALTGATVWVSGFNVPKAPDQPTAIVVSPDGSKVFVTGSSFVGLYNIAVATVGYDAATGRRLWTRMCDFGGREKFNEGSGIAVAPVGSTVFVTGFTYAQSNDTENYLTLAYDASTGATAWASRFEIPGGDGNGRAIGVSPGGSIVYVTGQGTGSGHGYDYVTIAFDAVTGQELWVTRYDGPTHGNDYGSALGVSPGGDRVYVTGYSDVAPLGNDYATVAYDASTGEQLWVRRYRGVQGGFDYAYGLAVSPGGAKVFVTGYSLGSGTGSDYATVAYRAATGEQLWVSRYDGPAGGADNGWGVAVSPGGQRVFVAGESSGVGTDLDYATVAYSA